jgi:MraZ protein
MLLGQFQATLTDKDRLNVPARFRHELGNRVIITKWVEGCVMLLSEDKLSEILTNVLGDRQIAALPVREVERFLLGNAFEIELDGQGRFVIPKVLKEFAQITKEVVFVGLVDRIEIWSKQSWDTKDIELQKDVHTMIDKLAQQQHDSSVRTNSLRS